jgi:hypothetical protein
LARSSTAREVRLALDAPQLHDRDSAGPILAAMVNFAMLGGSPGSACV